MSVATIIPSQHRGHPSLVISFIQSVMKSGIAGAPEIKTWKSEISFTKGWRSHDGGEL